MDRVNRVEVELRTSDTRLARAASDRVSAIWDNRVVPMMARVCDEAMPGEWVYAIDTLELDLGTIDAGQLDDVFVTRLEHALRTSLAKALARRRANDPGGAAVELLELYARTGNLPWWATTGATRETIAAQFVIAARDAEPALVRLLRRLAGDPVALNRLARTCRDREALAAVDHLVTRHAPHAAGVSNVGGRLRDLLRSIAMPEAALDHTPAPRVMADVAAAAPDVTRVRRDPDRASSNTQVADPDRTPSARDIPATSDDLDAPSTSDANASIVASVTVEAIDRAADTDPGRERAGEVRAAPVGPVAPTPTWTVPRRDPPGTTAQRSSARANDAIRSARRAVLAHVDEVYVDNAGLVIVWPFVERLFVRTGLVGDDRAFAGGQARERAIVLLDALATGQLEPFEPRLPLAKLLCGLPLDDDFELDTPVEPELLAEGERMLLAAIDRAPSFGELSVEAFRSEFLQRQGALTTRDGAWLLQVERRVSDVVLDRLPWPWTWISLPWMLDPLRVAW